MTAAGFSESLRQLEHSQKQGAGVPLYTRYVNRRLGRFLAAGSQLLGLSPNQVTLISGLFSFAGLALVAFVPTSVSTALGATALLVIGYAFDSADGQLARLQKSGSPAGEWLDHVVDAARNPAVHLAVLAALAQWSDVPDAFLWVPIAFTIVTSTRFFALILAEQLRGGAPDPSTGGQAEAGQLKSLLQLPSDTGIQNLTFILLPWPLTFAVVYGALFVLNLVLASASLMRKYREMKSLQGPIA